MAAEIAVIYVFVLITYETLIRYQAGSAFLRTPPASKKSLINAGTTYLAQFWYLLLISNWFVIIPLKYE